MSAPEVVPHFVVTDRTGRTWHADDPLPDEKATTQSMIDASQRMFKSFENLSGIKLTIEGLPLHFNPENVITIGLTRFRP